MIECTECGFRNEDNDHFCGGCREPLQWTGRRLDEAPEPSDPEMSDDLLERRGLVERVVDRITGPAVPEESAGTGAGAGVATSDAPPAHGLEIEDQDVATALAAEAIARAEREAEEAARRQEDAERRAQEQAQASEAARRHAEQAREQAERRDRDDAEAAERVRAEAAAAEAAEQKAAEAEGARLAAEARAREEAEAAEQARRAAALVARPRRPSSEAGDGTALSATQAGASTRPGPPARKRRGGGRRPPVSLATEDADSRSAQPEAVRPDRTRVRRPSTRLAKEPTRKLRPGDLVCGACGEGNSPSRNFCRRCGHGLHEAEVVRRPWWRRVIPHRAPRVHVAGERPGRSTAGGRGGKGVKGGIRGAQSIKRKILGPIGKATRVLMFVAVAAGAVGLTLNPSLRGSLMETGGDLFDRARRVVAPQYDPVTPIAATASSARADQQDGRCCAPDNVLRFGNTWWHASEGGVGQSVTITLDSPTDIAKFGIIPGAGDDAVWAEHPRPRELELDFLGDEGRVVATHVIPDVKDQHDSQSQIFDVSGAEAVTAVRVRITRVYGQGLDSQDVAISEIRLLTPR